MNRTIDSLIDGMVSVFQSSGYTERSVQVKAHTLHTIAKMHKRKGFDELNNEVITFFLDTAYARYQRGEISRVWYLNLVKTVDYLTQYAANSTLNMINRNIPSGLSLYWSIGKMFYRQ